MAWSKGASFSIVIQSLLKDMGTDATIHMYTDSSVAKGIATRQGLGNARHIEVSQLWLQGKINKVTITVGKLYGNHTEADIFAKHVIFYSLFVYHKFKEASPASAP